MAKAKIILKRRKSVRNTEKITRTMEMVSTAKYKQSHSRIANSAPYQEKLRELMAGLGGAGESVSHPLLESRPVKRSVVLLITSNRGLCGGYNSNLISRAVDVLREEEGAGIRTDLHVIGTKGISFFRYRNRELAAAHDDFDDKSGYAQVNRIAGDFLRLYTEGEVDRVTVIYQKFLSAGRQSPVAEVLLPLSAVTETEPGEEADSAGTDYLYSPDPESILRELLPAYFRTTLYNDYLQAVVGEHLARMVAMKNATEAAEKLIKSLTGMYNRARQSQITNEIAELMGGVEALK